MAHLTLRLFGGFEAGLPSGAPIPLPTKKAQALFAYCALRPGQAHQREKLATLLWGDTEECNARNSLRQTLFVLRTALRGNLSRTLRIAGDTVATEPQTIDVDVLAFERLAAERTPQALEQAAALYRGDLLEGFIVDEESFEQWLIEERERLRELAIEVLARLLRYQDAPGTTEAAGPQPRQPRASAEASSGVHGAASTVLNRGGAERFERTVDVHVGKSFAADWLVSHGIPHAKLASGRCLRQGRGEGHPSTFCQKICRNHCPR